MSKPSFTFFLSLILILLFIAPVTGQTRVGKLGVGGDVSMQTVLGAGSVSSAAGFGGGFNMSLSLMEGLSLRSKFSVDQLAWKIPGKTITTDFISLNGYLSGDLMPNSSFNVFPFVGGGFSFYDPKDSLGARPTRSISAFDLQICGGVGFEYFPNEFWSISLMPEYVLTNSQYYNGPANKNNDSYLRVSLQFRYYFFDQSFITKLVEAVRDRSKHRK
jgi:hypothetical protein